MANQLDSVRSWNSKKEIRPALNWCLPPPNILKWDVDGSSKGKPGETGIEGVLKDDKGTIKCMFAPSVGMKDSNEAEFLAIVFALELSLQ